MAYTAKWIIKNKEHPVIWLSEETFWSFVENDDEVVMEHMKLNKKYVLDRGAFLARDGLTFLHWVKFKDEESYKEWEEERKKLPQIDKQLEYTRVDEVDTEKYIHYRDGKLITI